MKRKSYLYRLLLLAFVFCLSLTSNAQSASKKSDTFKVYGNCGMCKETIEGALIKKDGVIKKSWDKKTKMLSITYNESKLNLLQIKQKLADVGYDTDEIRAKDETYNNLPDCCKYERPKK